MRHTPTTLLVGLVLVAALAANAFAYLILQQAMGYEPCHLCIVDRVAFGIVALGAALVLWGAQWRLVSVGAVVIGFGLVLGMASTVRHLWLEHNPGAAACLFPSSDGGIISYVLDAFAGTSDCSQIVVQFMGISLAGWTLVLLVGMSLVVGFACYCSIRARRIQG